MKGLSECRPKDFPVDDLVQPGQGVSKCAKSFESFMFLVICFCEKAPLHLASLLKRAFVLSS